MALAAGRAGRALNARHAVRHREVAPVFVTSSFIKVREPWRIFYVGWFYDNMKPWSAWDSARGIIGN